MTRNPLSTTWYRHSAALLTLWGVICLAAPARAQFDSAQLSGIVRDTTGGVLPGVDVTLTSVGTGIERRTVTNEAGLYAFPNAPVGEYKITAMLSGFRPVTQTGVNLTAGVNVRVDVQLALGAVSETILVVAATTLVDTAVIGRTLRAEEIAETPLSGRRASQVAQLAPVQNMQQVGQENSVSTRCNPIAQRNQVESHRGSRCRISERKQANARLVGRIKLSVRPCPSTPPRPSRTGSRNRETASGS